MASRRCCRRWCWDTGCCGTFPDIVSELTFTNSSNWDITNLWPRFDVNHLIAFSHQHAISCWQKQHMRWVVCIDWSLWLWVNTVITFLGSQWFQWPLGAARNGWLTRTQSTCKHCMVKSSNSNYRCLPPSPSPETALRLLPVYRILTSALEETKLINNNSSNKRKTGKKKKIHKEDLL